MHPRPDTRPLAACRVLAVALALLAVVGSISSGLALADEGARFVMVVHVSNSEQSVSRAFLAEAFLKKTTRWQNGQPILPVDQRFDLPIRSWFSESVLRRSAAAVRSYWQQRIFSGRGVPPPEVESDVAVLRYVSQHPAAVGYVSTRADIKDVKVLRIH
jgi:hypothetical protein